MYITGNAHYKLHLVMLTAVVANSQQMIVAGLVHALAGISAGIPLTIQVM
jgi:hypothetical protein